MVVVQEMHKWKLFCGRGQTHEVCYIFALSRPYSAMEVVYNEGDWVVLRIQPYRLESLSQNPNEKLSPRYCGPYQVMERVGKVGYKLLLPKHTCIHLIFHMSLLKPAMSLVPSPQLVPPMLYIFTCLQNIW